MSKVNNKSKSKKFKPPAYVYLFVFNALHYEDKDFSIRATSMPGESQEQAAKRLCKEIKGLIVGAPSNDSFGNKVEWERIGFVGYYKKIKMPGAPTWAKETRKNFEAFMSGRGMYIEVPPLKESETTTGKNKSKSKQGAIK